MTQKQSEASNTFSRFASLQCLQIPTVNPCNEFIVDYLMRNKINYSRLSTGVYAPHLLAISAVKKYPLPLLCPEQLATLHGFNQDFIKLTAVVIKKHYSRQRMPTEAQMQQEDNEHITTLLQKIGSSSSKDKSQSKLKKQNEENNNQADSNNNKQEEQEQEVEDHVSVSKEKDKKIVDSKIKDQISDRSRSEDKKGQIQRNQREEKNVKIQNVKNIDNSKIQGVSFEESESMSSEEQDKMKQKLQKMLYKPILGTEDFHILHILQKLKGHKRAIQKNQISDRLYQDSKTMIENWFTVTRKLQKNGFIEPQNQEDGTLAYKLTRLGKFHVEEVIFMKRQKKQKQKQRKQKLEERKKKKLTQKRREEQKQRNKNQYYDNVQNSSSRKEESSQFVSELRKKILFQNIPSQEAQIEVLKYFSKPVEPHDQFIQFPIFAQDFRKFKVEDRLVLLSNSKNFQFPLSNNNNNEQKNEEEFSQDQEFLQFSKILGNSNNIKVKIPDNMQLANYLWGFEEEDDIILSNSNQNKSILQINKTKIKIPSQFMTTKNFKLIDCLVIVIKWSNFDVQTLKTSIYRAKCSNSKKIVLIFQLPSKLQLVQDQEIKDDFEQIQGLIASLITQLRTFSTNHTHQHRSNSDQNDKSRKKNNTNENIFAVLKTHGYIETFQILKMMHEEFIRVLTSPAMFRQFGQREHKCLKYLTDLAKFNHEVGKFYQCRMLTFKILKNCFRFRSGDIQRIMRKFKTWRLMQEEIEKGARKKNRKQRRKFMIDIVCGQEGGKGREQQKQKIIDKMDKVLFECQY